MHEAIRNYEDLRNEVLTMTMFHEAENNMSTQAPAAMASNAVMKKIRASLKWGYEPTIMKDNVTNLAGAKRKGMNESDQSLEDSMAMVKGKGKGLETRECFPLGKEGKYPKTVIRTKAVRAAKEGKEEKEVMQAKVITRTPRVMVTEGRM